MTAIDSLARRTPATRDRYVDFLRALSIAVVVLGHWLMAIVFWRDGEVGGGNALEVVGGLWALTWVLQVMPLFFFVGGFANYRTYRSIVREGGGYPEFLHGRVLRLMRPTAAFAAVWLCLTPALRLLGVPPEGLRMATQLVGAPLWFLGVYLLVVALAPAMLALHQRHRTKVVVGLGAAAAAIDIARLGGGAPFVGFLNFAFVWLFAHQLGYLYADGTFDRLTRRSFGALAAAGLAATALLTSVGVYSRSMVGVSDGAVSNNAPPSVTMVALTCWLVGLAMLGRPAVSLWLARTGPWKAVVAANSMIMTAYLWHLSALVAAVLVALPLGWPQPAPGTTDWWLLRPVWIGLLGAFLVPFVLLFGRFERPPIDASRDRLAPATGTGVPPVASPAPAAGAGTRRAS